MVLVGDNSKINEQVGLVVWEISVHFYPSVKLNYSSQQGCDAWKFKINERWEGWSYTTTEEDCRTIESSRTIWVEPQTQLNAVLRIVPADHTGWCLESSDCCPLRHTTVCLAIGSHAVYCFTRGGVTHDKITHARHDRRCGPRSPSCLCADRSENTRRKRKKGLFFAIKPVAACFIWQQQLASVYCDYYGLLLRPLLYT